MNIAASALLGLYCLALPLVQTQDLGQGVFFNDEGAIVMALDAVVAIKKLDSPYIMFVAYMGAAGNMSAKITRGDVTLIHNGKEYGMPTIEEFIAKYNGGQNDWGLYERAGKESLILSQMRYWRYQQGTDFYPLQSQGILVVSEGSMTSSLGFRTRLYFKNPGFKKGDQIVIQVRDHSKPEVSGSCAVRLD
jgi:hypothetical protein